jgi:amidase
MMLTPASRGLAVAALAMVALTTASSDANDSLVTSQINYQPYPYDFPKQGINGSDLFPMRRCNDFKLEEASIDEIQAQLNSGKLTGAQLLQCYYERIYQVDPYVK